jgi:molybdenum cofactor sulfurtransferase
MLSLYIRPCCATDLSVVRPEFVVFSFYKMLGHPTGLGALLVRRRIGSLLAATYFGGGTVDMHLGNVVPWRLFH